MATPLFSLPGTPNNAIVMIGTSLLSPELDGKRQDILIEAVPNARRIAGMAGFQADPAAPSPVGVDDQLKRAPAARPAGRGRFGGPRPPNGFCARLQQLGWTVGQNIRVDYQSASPMLSSID